MCVCVCIYTSKKNSELMRLELTLWIDRIFNALLISLPIYPTAPLIKGRKFTWVHGNWKVQNIMKTLSEFHNYISTWLKIKS